MNRIIASCAAVAFLAMLGADVVSAQTVSEEMGDPSAASVPYLTGRIGVSEREQIEAAAKNYNLEQTAPGNRQPAWGDTSIPVPSSDDPESTKIYARELVRRYEELDAYCDSGIETDYRIEKEFKRCFQGDAYLIRTEYLHEKAHVTETDWSDGEYKYHFGGMIGYREEKLHPNGPRAAVPLIIWLFFGSYVRAESLVEELSQNSHINRELSDGTFTVLDEELGGHVVRRLSISNSDALIKRAEKFRNSKRTSLVEVANVRINPTLDKGDLSYGPPLMVKYSMRSHPGIFFTAIYLLACVVGFVFWLIVFVLTRDAATSRIPWTYKSRLWKGYRILIGLVYGALFVYAIFPAMEGGLAGGEGGLFFFLELVELAVLAGLALLTILPFLLSAYAAHWIARKLIGAAQQKADAM